MCEPVSTTTMFYATLAMTAVSAGVSYYSQQQAADAQADYQRRRAEQQNKYMMENAKRATEAYIDEATQQNIALAQEEEATSEELQELQRQRLQKVGTATATSEGAGLSFDALLADFQRQEAGYRSSAHTQLEWGQQQAQMNIKGFRSKAISRANSVRPYIPEPVQNPSLITPILQTAGAGLSAYGEHKNRQALSKRGQKTKTKT